MKIEVGNNSVRVQDPAGAWIEHEGEMVTTIVVPDGLPINVAVAEVLGALSQHIKPGATPAWIDAESEELQHALVMHLGIEPNTRPEGWHA